MSRQYLSLSSFSSSRMSQFAKFAIKAPFAGFELSEGAPDPEDYRRHVEKESGPDGYDSQTASTYSSCRCSELHY
jgi:hypothetical protein